MAAFGVIAAAAAFGVPDAEACRPEPVIGTSSKPAEAAVAAKGEPRVKGLRPGEGCGRRDGDGPDRRRVAADDGSGAKGEEEPVPGKGT